MLFDDLDDLIDRESGADTLRTSADRRRAAPTGLEFVEFRESRLDVRELSRLEDADRELLVWLARWSLPELRIERDHDRRAREYPTLVAARCVPSTTAMRPPERVSDLIFPVSMAVIISSRSFSTWVRYCAGSSPVSNHCSIVETRSASETLKSMTAAAIAASERDDSAVAELSSHWFSRVGSGLGPG
ncbi:hypothetical protein HYW94_03090 [Candidatus Uhrbacteria bacterium]|nr:hypothetical protein [Candidatus Uhrbacteria bacterium]